MRKNKQQVANKAKQLLIPFIYEDCEPNPTEEWLYEWTEDKSEPSGKPEEVVNTVQK